MIRNAITDKLGSKVILTFDLPIGIVGGGAKAGFTLTEDGNLRMVLSVTRDEANHNNLVCPSRRTHWQTMTRKPTSAYPTMALAASCRIMVLRWRDSGT